MKKRALYTLLLLAVLAAPARAENFRESFLSGRDWRERLTLRQKYMSLILPAALFKRFRVPLERELQDYIPTIDAVIDNNPYIEDEDISSIFASTVYVYEPGSRPALEAMERALEAERLYEMDGASPRLIAEPSDA